LEVVSMSLARLVVTGVRLEGRAVAEVARDYDVSRQWVHTLLARYDIDGEAGLQPRSRRPHGNSRGTPRPVEDRIVELRKQLVDAGLDAGAHTIAWHLQREGTPVPAVSTIWRILVRRGFVVPQPHKRPKSSYIRFQADQPNECWQADFTHYRLTRPDGRPGPDSEILTWLDDCSRYALSVTAHHRVTGTIVVATFRQTIAEHGIPASTLTDNGMVFTTRLSQGKKGAGTRNGLET
jgi:transposase InsO family protein